MYTEKIAVILKQDLVSWQKLNVAAFLVSAIAIKFPETHGKAFTDASGNEYLPFIKHPVLIYKAGNDAQLRRAFNRAKERGLEIGIYTKPLFSTKNEEENLIEISKCTEAEQELVGIVIYGENKKVDKALDGLRFHD